MHKVLLLLITLAWVDTLFYDLEVAQTLFEIHRIWATVIKMEMVYG